MDLLNFLLDSGPISDSVTTLSRLFVCPKLLGASPVLSDGFYSGAGSIELLRACVTELNVIIGLGKALAQLCAHRAGADHCDVVNFLKLHRLFLMSIKKLALQWVEYKKKAVSCQGEFER
jgi:hypothetical protein